MKPFLILLGSCLFTISACFSQSIPFVLSAPVDIPQTGSSKLLLLRNGNTLLFHFENTKAIVVKVFDKNHKEIASQKHVCEFFDINKMDDARIVGLYDINGEGVLLLAQTYFNRRSLIRFRVDGNNGKIIKEEVVFRSPSMQDGSSYFGVQKSKKDEYAIFEDRDILKHSDRNIEFYVFNNKHEIIRKAGFSLRGKDIEFKRLSFCGMHIVDDVVYCTMELYTEEKKGRERHFLVCAQLSENDTLFSTRLIALDSNENVSYTKFSYNNFADAENILIECAYMIPKNVMGYRLWDRFMKTYFCPITRDGFTPRIITELQCDKVQEILYSKVARDTVNDIRLLPQVIHTNKFGASTIIYQERGFLKPNKRMEYGKSYLGNIGISILNDDGKEIFAAAIPQKQYLFGEYKEVFYFGQTCGYDFIPVGNKEYILLNINRENFGKELGDSLIALENTYRGNTICYLMGKDRKLTKSYLFGVPNDNEDYCSILSSSDYDETQNTYAVIVRHHQGDKIDARIGWCTFAQ